MIFAEKLKNIRKQAGMSQEQLAEKLGVSRQAVTKWETEVGVPDIENLITISNLFSISIDELLSNEKVKTTSSGFLYESITEYDIAENNHFDIKLGGCSRLVISGNSSEKIKVRLTSNTLQTVANDFKVKIDDIRKRINIDVLRMKGITEAIAKQSITIFVSIPISYLNKIEVAANAETVEINSLECSSIELDIKANHLFWTALQVA
jgi:transcriptional regulator with XRE-family HTH domain/ribosomal protein L12E/L44/L45/RPP1/RPP2